MTSFLTFRLHGTIPAATGRELKTELRQAQEASTDHRRTQKQFFAKFDAVLDRALIGTGYFENDRSNGRQIHDAGRNRLHRPRLRHPAQ